MSDFTKYTKLRDRGASATDVWRLAEADGVDQVTRIRILRELFSLSLVEVKAVSIKAWSGVDLVKYQGKLIDGLKSALDVDD